MEQKSKKSIKSKSSKKIVFQTVTFKTIEDLLEFLPSEERAVTVLLRQLVFDVIPHCEEKLSYNVPFYRVHTGICFIWPGSVTWGGKRYPGVKLGFNRGNLLEDESDYLERGNRKQVYMKTFQSVKDIDVDLVKIYLEEALAIDDECYKAKKARLCKKKL